ncbi:hypothetical protein BT63DRAFT_414178 [Microthyrium microscopicum]|uniref:ferric-chelate reductase (NADPH) n=1 Tax=Microthyrium microscopicum TaxID=703497 RepID=A0A6A6U796_9PEZI|nr:hypothetical protein BT63DRAFT_414178 [Microthyrium microscopicum]
MWDIVFSLAIFWGSILGLGMLGKLTNSLWHLRASLQTREPEGHARPHPIQRLYAKAKGLLYGYLILPPLFGSFHRRLLFGDFIMPTRIEALVIFAFWALNIMLCSVENQVIIKRAPDSAHVTTVASLIYRRTGKMAVANLPWLWIFGARNNIFQWATGWNFSTFNLFHRHIARVVLFEAIAHAGAETWSRINQGKYAQMFSATYVQVGLATIIAMGLMVLLMSSIAFRRHYYEAFLAAHILLAVVVLVGLYFHIPTSHPEYQPYLWSIVAIWAFERLLRIVKLVYCNIRLTFSKHVLQVSKCLASWDPASDMVKVTITLAHDILTPKAGQFYFLYRPVGWKGWESHPFTLGSYTRAGPKQLVFWIRPLDGWTQHLREVCRRSPGLTTATRLFVEGPYGHPARLCHFPRVLLIAGGSGISSVVPYVEEHVHRASVTPVTGESAVHTRRMALATRQLDIVWCCPQRSLLYAVAEAELSPALSRNDITMRFFCSASSGHTSSEEGTISEVDVLVAEGRPDLKAIVSETAREHGESEDCGELAILVCGPASMADEVRMAVVEATRNGARIEYFEETFGW